MKKNIRGTFAVFLIIGVIIVLMLGILDLKNITELRAVVDDEIAGTSKFDIVVVNRYKEKVTDITVSYNIKTESGKTVGFTNMFKEQTLEEYSATTLEVEVPKELDAQSIENVEVVFIKYSNFGKYAISIIAIFALMLIVDKVCK